MGAWNVSDVSSLHQRVVEVPNDIFSIPDTLSVSQQRKRLEQWLDRAKTSTDRCPVEVRARLLVEMHISS